MSNPLIRLAKVTTGQPGVLLCHGVMAGDILVQAMALSNGDDVTGVFMPLAPGNDTIIQGKQAPGIECLLVLHRYSNGG
jgi:hypothetical protein